MVRFRWAILAIVVLVQRCVRASNFSSGKSDGERVLVASEGRFMTSDLFDFLKLSLHPPEVHPEAKLTVLQIISRRGYSGEVHYVTTIDGYVLEIHRISHGRNDSGTNRKRPGRPVMIQHGFTLSASSWLLSASNQSLAFQLADLGYDVWLGNIRGSKYSRRHMWLDASLSDEYWNFSFDEMGRYDIPVMIDYVLRTTGRSKLSYIGHSMGSAVFFVAMHYHPELNRHIDVMIALSPVTAMANIKSPLRFLAKFEYFFRGLRLRNFLSSDDLLSRMQRRFCFRSLRRTGLCRNLMFFMVGADTRNMPLEMMSLIDHHIFAGASVRTALHYAQNYKSGDTFVQYDYGRRDNWLRYGRPTPPEYDLGKVTCPVYLFYGPNDLLVQSEDVAWMESKLSNLRQSIRVNHDMYSHYDFLWAKGNNELLYNKIISRLPKA